LFVGERKKEFFHWSHGVCRFPVLVGEYLALVPLFFPFLFYSLPYVSLSALSPLFTLLVQEETREDLGSTNAGPENI
jgi:hypothetical protein